MKIVRGAVPLKQALRRLTKQGILEEVEDPYAGSDYLVSQDSRTQIRMMIETQAEKYAVYLRMGDVANDWLGRVFSGIESAEVVGLDAAPPPTDHDADVDHWTPLPLDRTSPSFSQAVEHLEAAIASVAADNGFSSEYPAERDNLVSHAEATLASAREGKVTKGQIRLHIVAAGKWLLEKFGGTAIGTVGGELVKWGLRLLGLIS